MMLSSACRTSTNFKLSVAGLCNKGSQFTRDPGIEEEPHPKGPAHFLFCSDKKNFILNSQHSTLPIIHISYFLAPYQGKREKKDF